MVLLLLFGALRRFKDAPRSGSFFAPLRHPTKNKAPSFVLRGEVLRHHVIRHQQDGP